MSLRKLLAAPDVARFVGAHDPMGARLAMQTGFDGVWASSLELATSQGVPDEDLLSTRQVLQVWSALAAAAPVPVLGDGGCGPSESVAEFIAACERAHVAGVCLEDSAAPRRNSLQPGPHGLAECGEFVAKLQRAISARQSREFLIVARVQALVAGRGLDEALKRASIFSDAGADAIVIHSRSASPGEVLRFVEAWDRPTPLILIPTAYPAINISQVRASGKVRLVIYANQGLRASVAAMRRVYRQILDEGSSLQAESWIAPLADVFDLQQASAAPAERSL